MANRPTVIWYQDGMYQGGTARGCNCINIFDPGRNLIAVYQKQPNENNLFLTSFKVTPMEKEHLMATGGNFVRERVLNEQKALTTQIKDNKNKNNGL